MSGILFYYNNLFVGFQCKFRHGRFHVKTSNSHLQMLNVLRILIDCTYNTEVLSGYRAGCAGFVQSGRDFPPQFAHVVIIVESAGQTALAVYSLVRVFLP